MKQDRTERIPLVLLLLIVSMVLLRNAWISEDAYITFRTVDNFASGYGLTWNTAERVQAYTNPLWMFLVSAFYALTGEVYFTSLGLSFVASMVLMHLSRWSEELIIWAGDAFRFVDLPDALCTGSSMMPQKKNPDVLELIRGKTGRVFGDLQSLLVLMKGLPLTYQRDMQEDKGPLFHAVDTVLDSISIFCFLNINP